MTGILYLDPQSFGEECIFSSDFTYDFSLCFSTNLKEKFADIINGNKIKLKNTLQSIKNIETDEDTLRIIKHYEGKEEEIFQDIEYICFGFSAEEVAKYIKNNPEIKNKKIILSDTIDLSWENLNRLEKVFGEDTKYLYFYLTGNTQIVGFNECKRTLEIINSIVEKCKQFDFSPLEQVMYIYDIVRNREYEMEKPDEDYTISRDLTSVLLGNSIVCLGYSNIFREFLNNLGIQNKLVFLNNKNDTTGHCRNIVYIKDEKYNIDGVYYFDPTWDSKRDASNSFLSSYKYFARTQTQMTSLSKNKYEDIYFGGFNESFVQKLEDFIREKGIKNISDKARTKVNSISNLIDGVSWVTPFDMSDVDLPECFKSHFDSKVKLDQLKEYCRKFNKPIELSTFIKLLYNVRKQQYYYDPASYPFGIVEIHNTIMNSKWEYENPEERLMKLIFGEIDELSTEEKADAYIEEEELDKKIESVRLARTLRNVLQKRNS